MEWPRRLHTLLSRTQDSAAMRKRDLLRRKVEDIDLSRSSDLATLIESMGRGGGFTAKKVAVGVDILRTMFRNRACTTFLSFPAALMATGVRGILRGLVERKLVDAVITTCGTADHDLARVWKPYYHGDFDMDDVALHRLGVKESGALMIGGGVSKHHTIWWNQFRGGLDLAVYITTAPEWDGSLSGARLREGISWGKVKETAKQVTIEGDATAILPLMIAAALVRPRR